VRLAVKKMEPRLMIVRSCGQMMASATLYPMAAAGVILKDHKII